MSEVYIDDTQMEIINRITEELSAYPNLERVYFVDSARKDYLMIYGVHKKKPDEIFAWARIRRDYSDKEWAIEEFVSKWKESDRASINIDYAKQFEDQVMRYGLD